MTGADYSKQVFVHYFRLAIEGTGKSWDPDYQAEIESAVDELLDEAKRQAYIEAGTVANGHVSSYHVGQA